jgi:hypothetical protein
MAVKIPPAVSFFLRETGDEPVTPEHFVAWMKRSGLGKEFRSRAIATVSEFRYADSPRRRSRPGVDFCVCPSGNLNPLSCTGKCSDANCRSNIAEHFAQSVALYAEEVFIVDDLTGCLLFDDLSSPATAIRLLGARAALRKLEPLMRAGVVRFGSPVHTLCKHCGQMMTKFRDRAADRLTPKLLEQLQFRLVRVHDLNRLSLTFSGGELFWRENLSDKKAASLRFSTKLIRPTAKERVALQLSVKAIARMTVQELLGASNLAQQTQSAVVGSDRIGAQAFAGAAGLKHSAQDVKTLERLQSIRLPYVEHLTVEEILELREKASAALPRFRNFLSTRILAAPGTEEVRAAIRELKEGAADVEAELRAIRVGRNLKAAAATAIVALAVVVCEATSFPTVAGAAFAGALAALNGLHPHFAKDVTDQAQLQALPSYVLWKAQHLLCQRK